MAKAGRKTKKNETMVAKIFELAKKGKTTKQIADIVGLTSQTIEDWCRKDFEFSCTLKELKAEADEMVEASLFKRATGYSHEEEKVFVYEGEIITHKTIKHYPPDSTAIIFWLKNRNPKEWRDKIDHGLEGKDGEAINIIIKDYTKKEDKDGK